MDNAEMKAGRFAKLARGRRIMERAQATWANGGFVRIGNATRYTDYNPKHADMVVMGKSGSIYVKSGKKTLCADFCGIQFSS